MNSYSISQGTKAHFEQISSIDKLVFGSTKGVVYLERKLELLEQVYITVASDAGGEVVGYGIGYADKGKYYLWMLAVLPEHRKFGIAGQIIEDQIKFAKDSDFEVFVVKSRPKWKEMLRLLIKMDFIISGFKTNEWGSDPAVWFEKRLD